MHTGIIQDTGSCQIKRQLEKPAQWHTSVVPATLEAAAGDCLSPGV
jgi:hypothetical protein